MKAKGNALPRPARRKKITFADYFKMNIEAPELAEKFGYTFDAQFYSLPREAVPEGQVTALRHQIEKGLPVVSLSNEMARREFLIAPVLLEVASETQSRIRVEYALHVSDELQGTLDYFLKGQQSLLVVEAKNADLERGFVQLVAELIALDQSLPQPSEKLYGAISIGNIWQFGILDRTKKRVTKDWNSFRSPDDLSALLGVLLAILKGITTTATEGKK
jgi:hypothetical protein